VSSKRCSHPIFIVGAPRSGTTLLRAILNKHPSIAICDESYFFYYVYSRRRAFGDLAQEGNRRRLVEAYLETWRIRRLGLDQQELERRLLREGTDYPALFMSLMEAYAESRAKRRPGEKTPHHAQHVETLFDWFPDATVIHVVRDPRDVVASLRKVPWGRNSVAANARLWIDLTQAAERSAERSGFVSLRYEDLVSHPGNTLRSLCLALGEPYVPELLSDRSQETPDRPWFSRAYEQPISRSRVGSWRGDLSRGQVRIVEWIAGSLMEKHGYEPVMPPPSALQKAGASLRRVGEAVRLRMLRLPASWYHWLQPRNLAGEEGWIDRGSSRTPRPS
jgi:hypothetical protein